MRFCGDFQFEANDASGASFAHFDGVSNSEAFTTSDFLEAMIFLMPVFTTIRTTPAFYSPVIELVTMSTRYRSAEFSFVTVTTTSPTMKCYVRAVVSRVPVLLTQLTKPTVVSDVSVLLTQFTKHRSTEFGDVTTLPTLRAHLCGVTIFCGMSVFLASFTIRSSTISKSVTSQAAFFAQAARGHGFDFFVQVHFNCNWIYSPGKKIKIQICNTRVHADMWCARMKILLQKYL